MLCLFAQFVFCRNINGKMAMICQYSIYKKGRAWAFQFLYKNSMEANFHCIFFVSIVLFWICFSRCCIVIYIHIKKDGAINRYDKRYIVFDFLAKGFL